MQCGLLTRFDSRRLTLQHGKVTVLHTLSHISSQDASLSLPSTRPVIDTKMYSTPSAVDDKRGFSSSLSRWMGMNSPMLLPRTILCAVTHTHTSRWIVVSRAHTHTRQCKLGRLTNLPSACGERDMAGGQPQTAKVIVMGSTQSLSPRQQ